MTQTEKAFHSLGKRVKEKITKREGAVTGVSFDLEHIRSIEVIEKRSS